MTGATGSSPGALYSIKPFSESCTIFHAFSTASKKRLAVSWNGFWAPCMSTGRKLNRPARGAVARKAMTHSSCKVIAMCSIRAERWSYGVLILRKYESLAKACFTSFSSTRSGFFFSKIREIISLKYLFTPVSTLSALSRRSLERSGSIFDPMVLLFKRYSSREIWPVSETFTDFPPTDVYTVPCFVFKTLFCTYGFVDTNITHTRHAS